MRENIIHNFVNLHPECKRNAMRHVRVCKTEIYLFIKICGNDLMTRHRTTGQSSSWYLILNRFQHFNFIGSFGAICRYYLFIARPYHLLRSKWCSLSSINFQFNYTQISIGCNAGEFPIHLMEFQLNSSVVIEPFTACFEHRNSN